MESIKVWDIFVRVFHWVLGGAILGMYLTSEASKGAHIRLGYFVIILVLARIVWGFVGPKHARFKDFLYGPVEILNYLKSLITGRPNHYVGHNPAGGLMVVVMLIALLVITFTGLKAQATSAPDAMANTRIAIPGFAYADDDDHGGHEGRKHHSESSQNEKKGGFWKEIHEFMTSFMLFLIGIHIAGVLVSSWLHKENLTLSMITGKKKPIHHLKS